VIHFRKSTAFALTTVTFCALLCACAAKRRQTSTPRSRSFVTLSEAGFIVDWSSQLHLTGGESIQKLYLVGDTLHAMSDQNIDYALGAKAGQLQYLNQIASPDTPVKGGPVQLGERVVFATTHTLEVYGPDGHLEKSIPLGQGVTGPPAGAENMIYLGLEGQNSRLGAVDITTSFNPVRWEVLSGGPVLGAPAVYQKEIYFGSQDGSVRAVDSDRAPLWPLLDGLRFDTRGAILADLKADKSGVYVACTDQSLYCLYRNTGKIKWRFFAGVALQTGPELTATSVYQFVPGRGLAAIDKSEPIELDTQQTQSLGEQPIHTARWTAPDATRLLAEDDRYAYVLSTSNTILALDKSTGQRAFASRRKDLAAFATNPNGSIIYAATARGLILAIQPVLTPGATGELALVIRPGAPRAAAAR